MLGEISANGILVWFVFGLVFGLGFNLTCWPFRRWAYA